MGLTLDRFTYAASFAALVATSAAEIHYWKQDDKAFDGTVLYFLIPMFLIFLNCFRIDVSRRVRFHFKL